MKKQDGRTLKHDQNEYIRRAAMQRLKDGEDASVIMESYGYCRTTIYKWLDKIKSGGEHALQARRHPGPKRKLTEKQRAQVREWICGKEPRQHALDASLWTRQIVAHLITMCMGITLSRTAVGILLRGLGITCQKPLRRAYERDPKAIRRWTRVTYPALKKRAKLSGAEIFFLDEAGIRSDAPLQRTWAERGKTPAVQTSGRRQSINAISAISPRGDFWYELYTGTLNAERFVEFLLSFGRRRKGPVILIVDGHPSHRSSKVRELVRSLQGRLEIVFLPPYAPDLNPDEFVWNYLRTKGTTKKPLAIDESLRSRMETDLRAIRRNRNLCRSFFRADSVVYTTALLVSAPTCGSHTSI